MSYTHKLIVMEGAKNMSTKSIIRKIAKEHGVSAKQVEADIKEAIRLSMMSESPSAKIFWNEISPDGKEPSADVFIRLCANKIKNATR